VLKFKKAYMANLQQTLDALQPYVIGIRYIDKLPVIDVVLKDGWTVLDSDVITKVKGNNELNYYMIYSEKEGIGIDELLIYVDATIKSNIEREKKHELLKEKVNELKALFKKTPLSTLKRLKFSFNDEDFITSINDFDLEETEEVVNEPKESILVPSTEEPQVQPEETPQAVELTEEELEILEEERRAENFRLMKETNKANTSLKKISSTVELPPRRTIEQAIMEPDCDCGPDEFCNKCMDSKGL
jgi:hypothetical protein